MQDRNTVIITSVAIYLIITVLVGIWAIRRTHSASDFFMAGKNLGPVVTAFAVFSSLLSGFGFVGGPAIVYRMGMSSIWILLGVIMGFNISFFLLAKRLRLFAEIGNPVSLPDVIRLRYNNKATQGLMGIAIILGVLGYLATQILAMGVVMREILIMSYGDSAPGILFCLAISSGILIFYSVTGGIIASVYTDLIQGGIMIVGAFLVFLSVSNHFEGGFAEISTILLKDDESSISPWGTLGVIGSLSWFFVFMLGAAGQPHVITKMMMYKKISDARHILPITIFGYFFSALLWISIGLAMRALVVDGVHPALDQADSAASTYLQFYTNPLLAGIVFAGLFAAIMSTADSFLNIGTAAIMHDIPKSLGVTVKNELLWARVTTVLLTLAAGAFALYSGDLVAILGAFGWGTFAAAVVPVVVLGFNWKRANALAANIAIITSLAVNFIVKIFGISIPYQIDVGAISLALSLLLFIIVSGLSKPKKLRKDVEVVMDA